MTFYFAETQVPELSALTKPQRRLVRSGAFELLRKDRPAAAIIAVLPGLGAIFGFCAVSGFLGLLAIEHHSVIAFGGGAAGGVVGSFIGAHIFLVFMRPCYRHYIQGHQDEIAAAA